MNILIESYTEVSIRSHLSNILSLSVFFFVFPLLFSLGYLYEIFAESADGRSISNFSQFNITKLTYSSLMLFFIGILFSMIPPILMFIPTIYAPTISLYLMAILYLVIAYIFPVSFYIFGTTEYDYTDVKEIARTHTYVKGSLISFGFLIFGSIVVILLLWLLSTIIITLSSTIMYVAGISVYILVVIAFYMTLFNISVLQGHYIYLAQQYRNSTQ